MKALDLQKLTVNSLEDLKGQDIVVLDVTDRTTVTDWMIVVTGTSARHVKSLANEVVEKSKEAGGITQRLDVTMYSRGQIENVTKDIIKNPEQDLKIPGMLFIDCLLYTSPSPRD